MSKCLPTFLVLVALSGIVARADDNGISASRLNDLDKLGAFTPDFKRAVHDFVDVQQAIDEARKDQKSFHDQLPELDKKTAEITAKIAQLQKQLAEYDHTDETDFVLVQKVMNDTTARPEDRLVLVQTYLWSYPTSSHGAEVQQYQQQLQKGIADRIQAEKDAIAAQVAARARLLQRVHDHDLSLAEWSDFLNNMAQDELLKYLGRPDLEQNQYWIYTGAWAMNPILKRKVGLRINFNGGRVINVTESEDKPLVAPVQETN